MKVYCIEITYGFQYEGCHAYIAWASLRKPNNDEIRRILNCNITKKQIKEFLNPPSEWYSFHLPCQEGEYHYANLKTLILIE